MSGRGQMKEVTCNIQVCNVDSITTAKDTAKDADLISVEFDFGHDQPQCRHNGFLAPNNVNTIMADVLNGIRHIRTASESSGCSWESDCDVTDEQQSPSTEISTVSFYYV